MKRNLRVKVLAAVTVVAIAAVGVAIPLVGSHAPAHAAAGNTHSAIHNGSPKYVTRSTPHTNVRATAHHNAAAPAVGFSTAHWAYVNDGTVPTNTISVVALSSGAVIQNLPVPGNTSTGYFGATSLATIGANGVHGACVAYLNQTGDTVSAYPINSTTGMLPSSPTNTLSTAGFPSDVEVSGGNNFLFVDDPGVDLQSFGIGANCQLTAISTFSTGSAFYISFNVTATSSAFEGGVLTAVDSNTGNVDSFFVTVGGAIAFQFNSAASQLGPGADGISSALAHNNNTPTMYLFTGDAAFGPPTTQASNYSPSSGCAFYSGGCSGAATEPSLVGSPASDPNPSATDGVAQHTDLPNLLQLSGDEFSGYISSYKLDPTGPSGWPGEIYFLNDTPLAASAFPALMTQVGHNGTNALLVDGVFGGDIEVCTLTNGGASGCVQLTSVGANTFSTGMSID